MADEKPEQQPKAFNKLFEKTKQTVASAGSLVSKATEQSGQVASSATTAAGQMASSATAAAGQMLGKASESAKTAADSVGEGFDVVSGKKILDLVEQRLELQARYNDVLATKLQEALQRIDVLEKGIQS